MRLPHCEVRRHGDAAVLPDRRGHALEHVVRVVMLLNLDRVREEVRQAAKPGGRAVRHRIHRERALAKRWTGPALRQAATRELVLALSIRGLEEHRRRQAVVGRGGPRADDRRVHQGVVETRNRAVDGRLLLLPAGVLEGRPERRHDVVVEPDRRLPRQQVFGRAGDLVVVRLTRRNVVHRRHREHVQHVEARLVETVLGDSAEHAAVLQNSRWYWSRSRRRRRYADPEWSLNRLPSLFVVCEKSP